MAERAKYVIVREQLTERVKALRPGDQLPPEAALCEEYEVSRITLRRAVEDLIAGGLLVREQGRGTFVTEPAAVGAFREVFANRVRGFYRQQAEAGNRVHTRVLHNAICRDAGPARRLALPPSADLIRLDRVRLVNGVIQQFSKTWLGASSYPRALVHDFHQGSLYEFLEAEYGVYLARNDLLVKVTLADAEAADALEAAVGEPLLAMHSSVFTAEDVPVAFGVTSFAPASSEILISLRDHGGANPKFSAQISETATDPQVIVRPAPRD